MLVTFEIVKPFKDREFYKIVNDAKLPTGTRGSIADCLTYIKGFSIGLMVNEFQIEITEKELNKYLAKVTKNKQQANLRFNQSELIRSRIK